MSFILNHSYLGFDLWTLITLICFIVLCVVFVIRHRQMKRKQAELEDQISEMIKEKTDEENEIPEVLK